MASQMTVDEMKEACSNGDYVNFTLPGPPGRGWTMRLFGGSGPRGEIICTNQQTGQSVVRFRSDAALRAIKKL
jgi:hypothetical protein